MPPRALRKRARRRDEAPLNDRLGHLRTLLHAEPSRAAWHHLGETLDDWTDPQTLALGLDYATAHLDAWPDALRVNRGRANAWVRRALEGHPEPRVRLLRHLRLRGQHLDLPRQVSPAWADLQELRLLHAEQLPATPSLLLGLAQSPTPLPHLTDLTLIQGRLDAEHLAALAASPNLPALTRLNLSANPLQAHALYPLLTSPHLAALTELEVARCPIERLRPLLTAPRLAALRLLDLSHTARLAPQALLDLSPTALPHLRTLRLAGCHLTHEHLAYNPRFGDLLAQLDDLDLAQNPLGAPGLRALLHAHPHLRIQRLDLTATRLNDDALRLLLDAADLLPHLTALRLGRNHFSARALVRFLQHAPLTALTHLELDGTDANDDVAQAILHAPFAPNLQHLTLHAARLSSLGARALLTQHALPLPLQLRLAQDLFEPALGPPIPCDDLLTPALLDHLLHPQVERALLHALPYDAWVATARRPDGWRLALHPLLPQDARSHLLHRMTILQLRQLAEALGLPPQPHLDRAALVPVVAAALTPPGP